MSESPTQTSSLNNGAFDSDSLPGSDNGADGFCNSSFGLLVRKCINNAPDLKLEILGHLMAIVDEDCLRELRVLSAVRALWKRTTGISLFLASPERHRKFCKAVLCFHNVGRFKTHPGIRFANITVLQIRLFPETEPHFALFQSVFEKLRIEDLSLDCGDLPSFMTDAVAVWAPNLQGLKILHVFFNRFASDGYQSSYPWREESWQKTLGLLSNLRTFWLFTSQVLCEEEICRDVYNSDGELVSKHQPMTTPNHLGDHLVAESYHKFIQYLAGLWASENPTLSRIYYSYAYDEHWEMYSPFRTGKRGRVLKMQNGKWDMTDLAYYPEDGDDGRGRVGILAHHAPLDGLPGILEEDVDMFADENDYW